MTSSSALRMVTAALVLACGAPPAAMAQTPARPPRSRNYGTFGLDTPTAGTRRPVRATGFSRFANGAWIDRTPRFPPTSPATACALR